MWLIHSLDSRCGWERMGRDHWRNNVPQPTATHPVDCVVYSNGTWNVSTTHVDYCWWLHYCTAVPQFWLGLSVQTVFNEKGSIDGGYTPTERHVPPHGGWCGPGAVLLVVVVGVPSEVVKSSLCLHSSEYVGSINLTQLDRWKLMIIYTDNIIGLHTVLRY